MMGYKRLCRSSARNRLKHRCFDFFKVPVSQKSPYGIYDLYPGQKNITMFFVAADELETEERYLYTFTFYNFLNSFDKNAVQALQQMGKTWMTIYGKKKEHKRKDRRKADVFFQTSVLKCPDKMDPPDDDVIQWAYNVAQQHLIDFEAFRKEQEE